MNTTQNHDMHFTEGKKEDPRSIPWKETVDRFKLTGKHAFVVGASKGIGQAVALGMLNAGAEVTVGARSIENLQLTLEIAANSDRRMTPVAIDVTDSESVDRAVQEAEKRAPISIIVVCAGFSARSKIVSFKTEDYRKIMETNVTGTWNCAQAAARVMVPRRSGKIILFGSTASLLGFNDTSPYVASKGAVLQLTKSLAVELAEFGIHVNAIGPGMVPTDMTSFSLSIPERKKWVLSRTPLARFGRPHEIADAVIFLASPASDVITGQILYVDGGFTSGSKW
jgi:gluconate 5-dehydrogenase